MPRGIKPKPDQSKLKNRIYTRFNDDDFRDLKDLVDNSDYDTLSEYIRANILKDLSTYRLSKSKQLRIE